MRKPEGKKKKKGKKRKREREKGGERGSSTCLLLFHLPTSAANKEILNRGEELRGSMCEGAPGGIGAYVRGRCLGWMMRRLVGRNG